MRTVTVRATAPSAISVNGVVISRADIAREVQNQTAPSPKQAWDAAVRALIVRELLLQRARLLDPWPEPETREGMRPKMPQTNAVSSNRPKASRASQLLEVVTCMS